MVRYLGIYVRNNSTTGVYVVAPFRRRVFSLKKVLYTRGHVANFCCAVLFVWKIKQGWVLNRTTLRHPPKTSHENVHNTRFRWLKHWASHKDDAMQYRFMNERKYLETGCVWMSFLFSPFSNTSHAAPTDYTTRYWEEKNTNVSKWVIRPHSLPSPCHSNRIAWR